MNSYRAFLEEKKKHRKEYEEKSEERAIASANLRKYSATINLEVHIEEDGEFLYEVTITFPHDIDADGDERWVYLNKQTAYGVIYFRSAEEAIKCAIKWLKGRGYEFNQEIQFRDELTIHRTKDLRAVEKAYK